MYAIVARWYAQEGKDDEVARILSIMIPHALSEPGCEIYAINRSPEDPRQFLLYEQYHDEAAFQAHLATEAFAEYVLGQAVPLLESRSREVYHTVDAVTK